MGQDLQGFSLDFCQVRAQVSSMPRLLNVTQLSSAFVVRSTGVSSGFITFCCQVQRLFGRKKKNI